jgi:hypothetical protein
MVLLYSLTNKKFCGIFPDHFFMVEMTTDKHFSFKITEKVVTNKNEGGFLICVIQSYKFIYELCFWHKILQYYSVQIQNFMYGCSPKQFSNFCEISYSMLMFPCCKIKEIKNTFSNQNIM